MAIATVNPATGQIVKRFEPTSEATVERALNAAHAAAARWRTASIADRAAVVRKAGELLDQRADEYARLMTLEMGKTIRAAHDEAVKCAKSCRYFADMAPAFLAREPLPIEGEDSGVVFDPLGVILAVMPWNF